jgi:hypothetical protein
MSRCTIPSEWPKHCTAHDPESPDSFDRETWWHYPGMNEGNDAEIFEHSSTVHRFFVCTKPIDAGWLLATICQNPPKRCAMMLACAQEAMRLNLEAVGSTAEIEAAETEAELHRMVGRVH